VTFIKRSLRKRQTRKQKIRVLAKKVQSLGKGGQLKRWLSIETDLVSGKEFYCMFRTLYDKKVQTYISRHSRCKISLKVTKGDLISCYLSISLVVSRIWTRNLTTWETARKPPFTCTSSINRFHLVLLFRDFTYHNFMRLWFLPIGLIYHKCK
jgi:hypothetical protein